MRRKLKAPIDAKICWIQYPFRIFLVSTTRFPNTFSGNNFNLKA